MLRPLFTVESNKIKLKKSNIKDNISFYDLQSSGYVEYLDVE